MAKKGKKIYLNTWLRIFLLGVAISVLVVFPGCKGEPDEDQHLPVEDSGEVEVTPPVSDSPAAQPAFDAQLDEVIKNAKTWKADFKPWYGKLAPEFACTDITGVEHKLSDFRGKDVLLVFWATWCGPCLREIPHLIELRKTVGRERLAILAISNENPGLIGQFANQQNINYTVAINSDNMPSPFKDIAYIPCSFFVDSQGRIKLATVGSISLNEIKAILGIG